MRRRRSNIGAGYLRALKFCGLLIAVLRILSRLQNDYFISLGHLCLKLNEITGVKMRDVAIKGAISYLLGEGFIEEFYVRIDKRKKLRVLRINKKGKAQFKKLMEKKKKDPDLIW